MMSVIRAFIAIDLPQDLHQCLGQVSNQLKEQLHDLPVRWVPHQNIHLTLKFLGDVSLKNIEMLTKRIAGVVTGYQEFDISVGGIGAYPKIQRPRVIWVGLEVPPELIMMQHGIEMETTRLGYAQEERPFSPHLTLGRVSRNANSHEIRRISEALMEYKVGFLGVAKVGEVHLYKSDLRPGGAVYSRVFTAIIGG